MSAGGGGHLRGNSPLLETFVFDTLDGVEVHFCYKIHASSHTQVRSEMSQDRHKPLSLFF